MGPPRTENLIESIRRCPQRVRLLTGPAGSGKSSACHRWYGLVEQRCGPGSCLLVVPTQATAQWTRRQLLALSSRGVLISPQVMTFRALAGRILSAGSSPPAEISPVARQVQIRRLLTQCKQEGLLGVLAESAETPGAALAVDRAISQLKRSAINPEALGGAEDLAAGAGADLLKVYQRHQKILREKNLVDTAGQMWLARDALAEANGKDLPGLENIQALAVDGFTDLTPTQLEILRTISFRVQATLITLCLGDDDRVGMWHWTRRTANALKATFGEDLAEIQTSSPAGASGELEKLQRQIFTFQPSRPCRTGKIHCLAAPNIDAEIRAVARRIKRLLLAGAPAGSISVLARTIQPYRNRIQKTFAEHNIPCRPAPWPLLEAGPVRFCMQVCSLAPEFNYRDVLGVMGSSYFRPEVLGSFSAWHCQVAEMVIRQGNVLAGRAAYSRGARRVREALNSSGRLHEEDQDSEDQPSVRGRLGSLPVTQHDIDQAMEMLEALLGIAQEACDKGPSAAMQALHLEETCRQMEDLELASRDLRALSRLQELLAELGSEAADLPAVTQALRMATCPPSGGESMVDVLGVLDARAMRWRHVFLLGLNEGVFPQPPLEDPLIPESQRHRWHRTGKLELDTQRDLAGREMLLFYLAISRARESLTLSYVEGEAGSASAGSFLQSAWEAIGLEGEAIERIRAGDLLPETSELSSRRDGKLAGAAGLFLGKLDPEGKALNWASANAPEYLCRAGAGIWVRSKRWASRPCGRWDGRISQPELLADLKKTFADQRVYSASQLNLFAACRWHYFARYVLNLEPLPEPARLLEATDRGTYCHEVLYRMMSGLRDQFGPGFSLEDLDSKTVQNAFDQASGDASQRVEAIRPDWPMLWQVQREQMEQSLRGYVLTQQKPTELQCWSLCFELAFGMPLDKDGDLHDPASRPEPVEIDLPGGKSIRLRGRIDRVDNAEFLGQVGLMVIDYKTGSLPTKKELESGQNVQLALYLEAVTRLLEQKSLGGAFHQVLKDQVQCFGPMRPYAGEYRPNEGFAQRHRDALEAVAGYTREMGEGNFSLYPLSQCLSWCPYRAICRHSPARRRLKQASDTPPAENT